MDKIRWSIKDGVKLYSEEFWYDLTDGGYIKPENLLTDPEQISKLKDAIETVRSFELALCDESLLD